MVANQRSQQEAFNELTRANKDKANDAMFAWIKTYDGTNRRQYKEWIDEINQVCRISGCDFRIGIIKKSTGAVCKVVMTGKDCSDDKILLKLRNTFSDAPHHEPGKGGTEKHETEW